MAPLRLLVVLPLFLSGCGGDDDRRGPVGDGGAVDGGGVDGGGGADAGTGGDAGLGCDPVDHCGAGGFECGVHAVASCGEVDCGRCRFRAEEAGAGDITTAPDGSVHLAFFDDTGLVYARVGDAGLERETVGDTLSGSSASLAVASDGAVHVVFVDDAEQVMHAERASGATSWDVQMAAESGEAARVAVDAAGALHIVVFGENPTSRIRELAHVTRSGGAYERALVDGIMPVGEPAVARGADGSIVVAVRVDIMGIAVLELVDGAFVRDPGISTLDDQPAELSVAVAPDGTIHLAAILGHYTLRTGSTLVHATREAGEWTTETLVGTSARVTRGMALASSGAGNLHLAYYAFSDEGLYYTRPGSSRLLAITPFCDDGWVRLAVDDGDQPHLLFQCDFGPAPIYMTPLERYSDEYVDACNTAADLICDRACECGAPDCCYGDDSTDSGGCTFGPGDTKHILCVDRMLEGLCSDLTAAPDALLACRPVLDGTEPMCLDTKYVVPAECWDIISSSR